MDAYRPQFATLAVGPSAGVHSHSVSHPALANPFTDVTRGRQPHKAVTVEEVFLLGFMRTSDQ